VSGGSAKQIRTIPDCAVGLVIDVAISVRNFRVCCKLHCLGSILSAETGKTYSRSGYPCTIRAIPVRVFTALKIVSWS
jgi:hypothetical protein